MLLEKKNMKKNPLNELKKKNQNEYKLNKPTFFQNGNFEQDSSKSSSERTERSTRMT